MKPSLFPASLTPDACFAERERWLSWDRLWMLRQHPYVRTDRRRFFTPSGHLECLHHYRNATLHDVPRDMFLVHDRTSFPPSVSSTSTQELLRGPKTFAGKGNVREVYIAQYKGRSVALKLLMNKSATAMHEHWVELVTSDAVSISRALFIPGCEGFVVRPPTRVDGQNRCALAARRNLCKRTI